MCSALKSTWVNLDGLWQSSVTIGSNAGGAHHNQLIPILHHGIRGGVDQAPVASRVHLTEGSTYCERAVCMNRLSSLSYQHRQAYILTKCVACQQCGRTMYKQFCEGWRDAFVTAGCLQSNMLTQRNAPEHWQGRKSFESHQAKHAAIRKIVRQLSKRLALQQQPLCVQHVCVIILRYVLILMT